MEQVLAMGSELFATVLMGLLILLTGYVKRFVQERIALIEDEKIQKLSMNALVRAEDIVDKVVKKMQQTTVQSLKEVSMDGKLTREEIEHIARNTKQEIHALINPDLYHALQETVDDVDLYLKNLVEAKVLELKNDFVLVNASGPDFRGPAAGSSFHEEEAEIV